jgi:Protein of unknown function (DUF2975)
MAQEYPDTLGLSRKVLRVLIVANIFFGTLIFVLLMASIIANDFVWKALGVHPAADAQRLVFGMRTLMVIGIAAAPLTHIALKRLLSIVDTVRSGDPFLPENAARLLTIAWAAFGLEVLHLAVGIVRKMASSPSHAFDINWEFSLTGWLAVLLLFVLARVFDQGTRMREDLQGVV